MENDKSRSSLTTLSRLQNSLTQLDEGRFHRDGGMESFSKSDGSNFEDTLDQWLDSPKLEKSFKKRLQKGFSPILNDTMLDLSRESRREQRKRSSPKSPRSNMSNMISSLPSSSQNNCSPNNNTSSTSVLLSKALQSYQEKNRQLLKKSDMDADELRFTQNELTKLGKQVERLEKENEALVRERDQKYEVLAKENEELRRTNERYSIDLRIAMDTISSLKAATQQQIADLEIQLHAVEAVKEDLKSQLSDVESNLAKARNEKIKVEESVELLGKGMWDMLEEKVQCVGFLNFLIKEVQKLFYNPTAFLKAAQNEKKTIMNTKRRLEVRNGEGDLRIVLDQLEEEVSTAAQAYTHFIKRIIDREEELNRMLMLRPDTVKEQVEVALSLMYFPHEYSTFLKTDESVNSLNGKGRKENVLTPYNGFRNKHIGGTQSFTSSIDWLAALEDYQRVTHVMEQKVEQLSTLKKILSNNRRGDPSPASRARPTSSPNSYKPAQRRAQSRNR